MVIIKYTNKIMIIRQNYKNCLLENLKKNVFLNKYKLKLIKTMNKVSNII